MDAERPTGCWSSAAVAACALAALLAVPAAAGGLPTVAEPTTTVAEGDFLGLIAAWAKDIGLFAGLVLCLVAFVVVMKNVITKYSEIASRQATWGEVGMHAGLGMVLLVVVVYLATEAAQIL